MSDLPSYLDEYKEAGECFRRGFGLLFDIIKLFLTFNFVLGAIIAFIGKDKQLGEWQAVVSSVAALGIFSGWGAGVIYHRVEKFANVALERASFIETEVEKLSAQKLRLYRDGLMTHTKRPRLLSASNTTLFLFASISILWSCFVIFVVFRGYHIFQF